MSKRQVAMAHACRVDSKVKVKSQNVFNAKMMNGLSISLSLSISQQEYQIMCMEKKLVKDASTTG